jgi:hypothetical protein
MNEESDEFFLRIVPEYLDSLAGLLALEILPGDAGCVTRAIYGQVPHPSYRPDRTRPGRMHRSLAYIRKACRALAARGSVAHRNADAEIQYMPPVSPWTLRMRTTKMTKTKTAARVARAAMVPLNQ